MLESYEDLKSSIGILSNRFRKYLEIVRIHSPTLRSRLSDQRLTGKVHLWRKAPHYKNEMQLVMKVARDQDEIKTFLGTYYALQVLHLHFLNIDWLRREASNYRNRLKIYKQILTKLRVQLKNLVSCYLSALVEVFAGKIPMDGIVISNVGMILDQDDLDVGVLVRPDIDHAFWNKVISQVSHEYLKYSTKMHFYLAERVARSSFLTTLNDFEYYLEQGANNYVLVSELLLTEELIGDASLNRDFETQIIDQFYFSKGSLKLHEGYLRGMMGEVQELSRFDLESPWIAPKNLALRLIHNLTNMLKTIHDIRKHGSRDTLETLMEKDHENSQLYNTLQEVFSFIELFFYAFQLIVSVEDDLDSSEPIDMENLDQVAIIMGLPKLGIVRPAMRLMTLYYENLNTLASISERLMGKINTHLKNISIFNQVLANKAPSNFPANWTDNIAQNFLEVFKVFRDVRYWDDVLEMMHDNNSSRLRIFIDSLLELEQSQQIRVFRQILRLLIFDMDSMVKTSGLFSSMSHEPQYHPLQTFLQTWFVNELCSKKSRMLEFVRLIDTNPDDLALCLLGLGSKHLLSIYQSFKEVTSLNRMDSNNIRFSKLCELLIFSSNNYRRLFSRVVRKRPSIVTQIDNHRYLEGESMQMYAELADVKSPVELKKKLATFYEFSFCRCGISLFNEPGSPRSLYDDYNSFFRRYFRWLYRACQWQVESVVFTAFNYRDMDEDDQPIGIFCTGGYAREEAFENDIDLFVLSNETDPVFLQYANKIINDMNLELLRESVMPQYRFADFTGSFVMTKDELSQFIQENSSSSFIELSQLLGSRLLVGGQKLDNEISTMLERSIFQKPMIFIHNMISEIDDRETYYRETGSDGFNVREDSGALRDIQLIVIACQALVGIREPVIWQTLETLGTRIPQLKSEFQVLREAYRFMRIFKDIHVLSISETESITLEHLVSFHDKTAARKDEIESTYQLSKEQLVIRYNEYRGATAQAIKRIQDFLIEKLDDGE